MCRSVAVEVCRDSRATTPRNDSKFSSVTLPRLETFELSTGVRTVRKYWNVGRVVDGEVMALG